MATVPLLIAGGGIPESVFSQNTQSFEQLPEWTWSGKGEDSFHHTLDPAPSLERVKVATFGLKVLTPSIVTLVDYRPLPKRETHSRVLADVYFDEDRNAIRGDAALAIQESVDVISKQGVSELQIEAHCDGREPFAYGMALGNRRAHRAAEYAKGLGLPKGKVTAVTFGPVKPQCRESHTRCWEDNLRLQHTFQFLAIQSPRLGCLTRLRAVSPNQTGQRVQPTPPTSFLQRIRLAEAPTLP